MDDYAGRVLADRYRLPLPPSDAYEAVETRAFDTYSGQEVLVRQVPLPEVVDAEFVGGDGRPVPSPRGGRAVRGAEDPAVRRAIEAAQAAAQVPDHPRLDQVFDVFAEAGSLWIVSELVASRPLAALLAERPLTPYRAAEIGSDVLAALRVLHAHGWIHRNITVRTVLVCDDGRVVLTGLAAGAAEEALCGYDTVPRDDDEDEPDGPGDGPPPASPGPAALDPGGYASGADASGGYEPGAYEPGGYESGAYGDRARPVPPAGLAAPAAGADEAARARAGAIAAYRAGTRAAAAARIGEEERRGAGQGRRALPQSPDAPGRPESPYGDYRDGPDTAPLPGGPVDVHEDPADEASGPWPARPGGEYGAVAPPRPRPELPELPGGWVRDSDAPDPYDGVSPYDSVLPPYDARYDDEDDEADDEDDDGGPPPRRLHLTGSWDDGPAAGRPVPAGGSREDALRADAARRAVAPYARPEPPARGRDGYGAYDDEDAHEAPAPRSAPAGRWDDDEDEEGGYRGPVTALAAERARQARIAVVGAVTERWAPEQAGPVHGNWQLAPPIGPATDLWALGALLYRAVQGHAPYPEDSASELVQMVCGEPPAFAEECGPLRPVVESLLRQDPTERPDVEELSGWLRSLVRSAPEPEAGRDVVPLPAEDPGRLPVVRRRGELVRRRRARRAAAAHARHRDDLDRTAVIHHEPRIKAPREPRAPRAPREPRALRQGGEPRRLGRTLLVLILLLLAATIAYAVLFMPKDGEDTGTGAAPAGTASAPPASATPEPAPSASDAKNPSPAKSSGAQKPQTSRSAAALAPGYTLRKDPEGFEVGLPRGWQRSPANAERQIRYGSDGFSVLIVPGRDSAKANGSDPLDYQRDKEPELKPFRDSSWSSATGLRRTDVGRQAMAEGQFTWQDANGREVYVRNLVMLVGGRYHILQVIGPEDERDRVSEIYQQASVSYRVTG
ncbi:protein kinase [Streptomyces sp. NPDC013181]|uniref:protein kinase n=1 Tax=Streptomyces sp. NPDC013181 TaxID=3364864 RepID=UPI0036C42507